jgi:esterase
MTHLTGSIKSGDVDIFYRRFGTPGLVPMLLFHGGNYYDSHDLIDVAEVLAQDREVVAFDSRGFGESGWSPSKNYSHSAQMADVVGLLNHLGWKSAVMVGHSRGGAYALLTAARFSNRVAGLVLIDYCPGIGIGPRGMPVVETQSIGNRAKVFLNADAALASTSRYAGVPEESATRQRFANVLQKVDGGVVISKRDPDFANQVPTTPGQGADLHVGDMWVELTAVRVPTLVIRALKSASAFTDADIERLRDHKAGVDIVSIEAGPDVVAEAPDKLIASIKGWTTQHGFAADTSI